MFTHTDTIPDLARAAELASHLIAICGLMPSPADALNTAEELIDKAERRGAVSVDEAASLWRLVSERFGPAPNNFA